MINVSDTILSQYANSQTIVSLIDSLNTAIDPSVDIDAFYSTIWDVSTAKGYGLDIWGKIVGVSRALPIVDTGVYLGFKNASASDFQPFGQGTFYTGNRTSGTFNLQDDAFRTLILIKAMSNISRPTVSVLNNQLLSLFKGRGKCWVNDIGGMLMTITFTFPLSQIELSILNNANILIRPAGVKSFSFEFDLYSQVGYNLGGYNSFPYNKSYSGIFGFSGSGLGNFSQSVMFKGV